VREGCRSALILKAVTSRDDANVRCPAQSKNNTTGRLDTAPTPHIVDRVVRGYSVQIGVPSMLF